MLQINAALGGLADVIGQMLTERGREDASGARRAILARMNAGNFEDAARLLGCDEETARNVHFMFADWKTPNVADKRRA